MYLALTMQLSNEWCGSVTPFGEWAGVGVASLIGLLLLVRLITAVLRHSRYRAVSVLDEKAQGEVAGEIARAEDHTCGEIAVVVLERSDRHPAAHWISGTLFLLLGSAVLAQWMPWDNPVLFFGLQAGLMASGALLALALPGFRRGFVTGARATEMAEEQSAQEFYSMGLHQTEERTGVLLFVSLFEHRVIVLGDEGIDSKLGPDDWAEVRNCVLDGIKAGDLHLGLIAAVQRVGQVLAEHFPVDGDNPNELENHVVVRRE